MEDEKELAYSQGQRAVYTEMISTARRGLGYEDTQLESMIIEREAVISALRSLCEEFGDNDWDEKLSLVDVINKHLGDHLYEKA